MSGLRRARPGRRLRRHRPPDGREGPATRRRRARRGAGGALRLALGLLAAPLAAGAEPAVEVRVSMPAADRALVRTAIRPGHPWTASPGFHRLSPTADERFRREPVRLAPAASGGLILEAEVRRSPDGFFRIPLLLPDDPGDSSAGGAADLEFRARIEPPSGHRIADAFPSRAETDADGALRIELPAPPSLLRFRVVSADASAVGLPQLVDGAVLVLLLGLAALGGRRLFAPRGRPPPPAG